MEALNITDVSRLGAVVWSPLGWGQLIGARNEEQLRQNLAAAEWTLSPKHMAQLDAASFRMPPYPYYPCWNGQFAELNPPPVAV